MPRPEMSFPSNSTVPLPGSAASIPAITRSSVVLPDPLGPSSPTSSPERIDRSTDLSTRVAPNDLEMLLISMLMRGPR